MKQSMHEGKLAVFLQNVNVSIIYRHLVMVCCKNVVSPTFVIFVNKPSKKAFDNHDSVILRLLKKSRYKN